jgi:leucyl aminopeptidase
VDGKHKTIYLTPQKGSTTTITTDTTVKISEKSGEAKDYLGNVTDFLSSAYVFWRKSKPHNAPTISVVNTSPKARRIIALSEARNQTREWGNGRGDIEGAPQFFQKISEEFAKEHDLKITVISGDDLLKERFGLMHAVGRASDKPPVFVNIAYNGNQDSNDWVSYVGKGVCFDSGGLNIKTGIFTLI